MKKFITAFLEEFKEFALKRNIMDLAIGVIIGGAFTSIVSSFTDCFINPLLNIIGGTNFGGKIPLPGPDGNAILWGKFLSAVVNFLIIALILFFLMKAMDAIMSIGKKKEDEDSEPLTRICPFCKTEIPIDAIRCGHCTSELPEEAAN